VAAQEVECQVAGIEHGGELEDPADLQLFRTAVGVRAPRRAAINPEADVLQRKSQCQHQPRESEDRDLVSVHRVVDEQETTGEARL